MALDDRERLLVFEIVDIPAGSTAFELWDELGMSSAPQSFQFHVASEAVDHLLGLLGDAEENLLREYIVQWDEIKTDALEITEAEGAKGVLESSEARRGMIRRRVQNIVPLFRVGEVAERERSRTGGTAIRRG